MIHVAWPSASAASMIVTLVTPIALAYCAHTLPFTVPCSRASASVSCPRL
jgi:hypothetical protein